MQDKFILILIGLLFLVYLYIYIKSKKIDAIIGFSIMGLLACYNLNGISVLLSFSLIAFSLIMIFSRIFIAVKYKK